MTSVFLWYLTMQLFALAALPLAFRVCSQLYDRGYGLAKGLGLVLITYIAWLLGHTSLADYGGAVSFRTVSIALLAVGLISVVSLFTHLREITRFVQQRWRIIAAQEVLLVLAFAAMLVLRGFVPHISYHIPDAGINGFMDHAAEKFTDFAVLNSLLTSPSFPPHDAWVAGIPLNYYYFGHLMWAGMIKFASVRPEIGFNLALGSVFALTCTLSFSLGYNLTRRLGWGALLMFLVALSSNLDGFLQLIGLIKNVLIDRHGDGAWFYMSPWWRNYDFWRSSRAVEHTITEFPAFSFVLGDLHAHLSSLVIYLSGLILAVQIYRSARRERSLFRYEWLNWDELILAAILTGAMSAANSWDAITYAVVLTAVLWASRTGNRNPYAYQPAWLPFGQRLVGGLASAFVAALVTAGGVLGLFWLFISRFKSPLPAGKPVIAVPPELRTHPLEFFSHWALTLVPVVCLLSAVLVRSYLPRFRKAGTGEGSGSRQPIWAALAVLAAVACVLVPLWQGWVAILLAAGTVGCFLLLLLLRLPPAHRLLLGLLFCFCLLAWFCEMFALDDIFGGEIERINTVFKIYYGLWPLAAVMAVLSLHRLVRYAPRRSRSRRAILAVGGIVLLGAAYPIIAPLQRVSQTSRLGHFNVPQGSRYAVHPPPMYRPEALASSVNEALDGMRYLKYLHEDDYYAMHWLRQNVAPDAVILEAVGSLLPSGARSGQYTYSGRFSTMTGRPSFGGWLFHSYGWRGESFIAERDRRMELAQVIYEAPTSRMMLNLLRQEGIQYVIVGEHERNEYQNLNEAALDDISEMKYLHGQTAIYQVNYNSEGTDAPPPPLPVALEEYALSIPDDSETTQPAETYQLPEDEITDSLETRAPLEMDVLTTNTLHTTDSAELYNDSRTTDSAMADQ